MKQTATQIKMPGMLNVLNISPIRSFDTEPWAAFYCRLSQDDGLERTLLGLDSDTFYIYHVAAVMVDNLRRLLLGINLSDKAIMDFDFPGVGFPV